MQPLGRPFSGRGFMERVNRGQTKRPYDLEKKSKRKENEKEERKDERNDEPAEQNPQQVQADWERQTTGRTVLSQEHVECSGPRGSTSATELMVWRHRQRDLWHLRRLMAR